MRRMAFRSKQRVRFGDVDHARIVYYPRYLHYFHVAFEDWWEGVMGVPYAKLMGEQALGFPAVHIEVDFLAPLRFGDDVAIEVAVDHVGASSVRWAYRVMRLAGGTEEHVGTCRITTVALDMRTFQKVPVPEWLRAASDSAASRTS
ncbi:MAG: thioesterase family protein [Acidobacteriota bacterium]